MFQIKQTWQIINYIKYYLKEQHKLNNLQIRCFKTNVNRLYYAENNKSKEIALRGTFESTEKKTKNTYLELINIYVNKDVHRRGHVEFIYSALKNMEQFGVQKDLEVYKSLINVLPKGKFIPTNIFQAEFMHYPKQQQCAIDLLQQMEDNGVMPDYEIEDILMNIFGKRGYPLRKFWRMMYWMPKFKNLSPWPVPNPPPNDIYDLAKMAIERIASADIQSKLSVYQTVDLKDSVEDTWIISAQSPSQQQLLKEHNIKEPVYIEGAFKIWLRNKCVNYFILRANPKPIPVDIEDFDDVSNITFSIFNVMPPKPTKIIKSPTVHEQEDGVILAVCATGTSSKDSLLSWIRHLEKDNPNLTEIPVIFTLRASEKEISIVNDTSEKDKIDES